MIEPLPVNRSDQPGWLKAGSLRFSGGANMSVPPSEVDADQVAFAVNATFRNGPAKPRPGWKRIPLAFESGCKTPFQSGFFQEGSPYNGATQDSLLSSHGGRQFKIDIDTPPGVLTVTTSNFTIPAADVNVTVAVTDSTNLYANVTTITIAGYDFTLVSVDSLTQITVNNTQSETPGTVVASGSDVRFLKCWTVTEITPKLGTSTTTTAAFTIPVVGATVTVSVLDATAMVTQLNLLTIGTATLILTAVNGPTSITVENKEVSQVGVIIALGATVTFNYFDVNSPTIKKNWSLQAETYWFLQDNSSYSIIFDGAVCRRADEKKDELPIGNVMAYVAGRIAVALPDRQSYRIGNLVLGNGLTSNILLFTENNYLNEGGDLTTRTFSAPGNSGEITSMKPSVMADTALGQGPLIVGTPAVIFTVNLPFDRTTWKDLANPLATQIPISGPTGQDSTVIVNEDQEYRSLDGVRTYIQGRREINSGPGNTPISAEVEPILSPDTQQWLEFGSAVDFDNRTLRTISPQMTGHGCYHRGLLVRDLNPISGNRKIILSMGVAKIPAWDCLWTGIRILKIVTVIVRKQPRCFLWVLNDDSEIELWELTKADKQDTTAVGKQDITWEVQLPSYTCGDADKFKKLMAGRAIITDLFGPVGWQVQYRSDESACWNDWDSGTLCATDKDCGPWECTDTPTVYQSQPRYPLRLLEPPDDFDDITKRKKRTGYEIQIRVKITGHCSLRQFRIYCIHEPENLGVVAPTQT